MQDIKINTQIPTAKKRPRVVIVGAGFGGMYAAKNLLPFVKNKTLSVTIINETNYFLFTPLLHEVATGGLNPTSVTESLREIFSGTPVEIFQGRVTSIDQPRKVVKIQDCEIPYDYLVVATGAKTNYFGTPGAEEHTIAIKNLRDAVQVREKIIDAFEEAHITRKHEEQKKFLTFVVVGGGATGVEMVGELHDFVNQIMKHYYVRNAGFSRKDVSIKLVHAGAALLNGFQPTLQKKAERDLKHRGVEVLLNKKVTNVEKESITLSDGMKIRAHTIIWSAGVAPVMPEFLKTVFKLSDRVVVDEYLRVQDEENIFVLGDSAYSKNRVGDPLPMLAQVAIREASIVAKNIVSSIQKTPLNKFRYHSKGSLISLGRFDALGQIFGINISGPFAWFIWRTVYFFKFISFKKKLEIVVQWTANIFFARDITKLN